MTSPLIDIQGLEKCFGSFTALDGLNLQVDAGEVHGFLGPNGSGKSTTIRVILGLLASDGGMIRLFGRDPWADAVELHRRLAYVPGDVTLWPNLSGNQCLDILSKAQGSPNPTRRAELVERFDLDPTKKARDYSKGNRQKVSLISALASDAELLILDEPTSGLDPLMEQVFVESVRQRVADGTTVLLSSHILAEVEALADRVSIIRAGRTVSSGTLDEMRRHTHTDIHASTEARPEGLDTLAGVGGLHIAKIDGHYEVRCSAEPDAVSSVLRSLNQAGIVRITATPPSLDELFLESYATERGEVAS